MVTIEGDDDDKKREKKLSLKNNAPCRSYISKFIDNAEDLGIIMYNLMEYSDNYSMRSGNLCNYYRDEINDDANENNAGNNRINNKNINK